jgi:thiamine-phosphate pyrophosphorylase
MPFPRLYAILDSGLVAGGEPELAAKLANAGVTLIQYRNKTVGARQLFDISCAIRSRLSGYDARLIINDRVDVALAAGAGGVHVGQDDLPVQDARVVAAQFGGKRADFWIGFSTHTLEQVREADATSADYVAVGPIFETVTKQVHDPIVGIEFVRQARQLTRKPLVAIGGISAVTAAEIFAAGADCVAVSKDLMTAADPAKRAREYLSIGANGRANG